MARVGSDGSKYPPSEFSQKYAPVLAPKGKLVSPKDVFGEAGIFDDSVEEKTRQAFKVTMKKLEKLNAPSDCKEDLARERIDQVFQTRKKIVWHAKVKTCMKSFWKTPTLIMRVYEYGILQFCKLLG